MIHFYKYQGTGNDFILLDDRNENHSFSSEKIKKLCDRHFGIGADGLILLRNKVGFDFDMLYYNSDGLPGSMCGNGGRCAAAFAHSLGLTTKKINFNAFDGSHQAEILKENPYSVRLHMNDVLKIESNDAFVFLDTGSPHYCCFVKNVNEIDVIHEGRKIRYNERFKKDGVNVNFIEQKGAELLVRTYERGVEAETLSCGTGVTASVVAASFTKKIRGSSCKVVTPGGILHVYFSIESGFYKDIWLEGPAEEVFRGEI